ncbi:MAG: hypothetical protein U0931_34830 [Vulcanimicrobiota bacterium]
MDFQAIAAELYGLPLDEFVAARDHRAAAARRDKHRGLANSLKDLAKPTVGAWAVNRLVRACQPLVDQWLQVGQGLREAQAQLDGERLRQLSAERRRLSSQITSELRRLGVSTHAEQEALDTLLAAVADSSAAEQVRQGCLSRGLRSSGFAGLEGISPARPLQSGTPEADTEANSEVETEAAPETVEGEPADVTDEAEPPLEVKAARSVAETASARWLRRRLERAEEEIEEAQAERDAARERVDSLRERLAQARERLKAAEENLRVAESERDEVEAQLDEL